jgi:enhancing lycopene biosynthesis protein 2
MAKIGVVLSGCGVFDGAEIHESVLSLYFLDQGNHDVVILAPNMIQHHVINHLNGEEMQEERNVRVESARIARGPVLDLGDANPKDYDAIILPGGFGAAKNLCNFALVGADGEVQKDLKRFLIGFHQLGRPIGAICISPCILALLSKEIGKSEPLQLTIGSDPDTAKAIESLNSLHETKSVFEISIDEKNRLVSTPAYMIGESISDVAKGIEKLIAKVVEMI